MSEFTEIMHAVEAGDPSAPDKLLPLVYEELRQLAATHLANEQPGQTLQPTALVGGVLIWPFRPKAGCRDDAPTSHPKTITISGLWVLADPCPKYTAGEA